MFLLSVIFWLSLFFLFYNYFGYAILTYLLIKLRKKNKVVELIEDQLEPFVTIVIAAYNEADFIEQKIENTLQLNYPKEKLQYIFITDGSTDTTPEIISKHSNILLLHQPVRRGKTAALNRAMQFAIHPIIIMCDANTILSKDCIKEIVKHYANPEVGAVAGEKKVLSEAGITKQEGLYWKYESMLKKLDAIYHSIVGAAGELFSFRKELWTNLEEDCILDDFMISMRIAQMGYRVLYEPKAYAIETASATVKDEAKRKIRIAAGGFQSMSRLIPLLNIFKYGKTSFLYISHRVLRWAVCPFCLLLIFFSNLLLVIYVDHLFYQFFLIAQIIFYTLISINWLIAPLHWKIPFIQTFQYFIFMNACVIRGLIRYLQGKQSVKWERAERQIISKTVS